MNRLDLIQAVGKYPPPPGESNILGVEGIYIADLFVRIVLTFVLNIS